MKLDSTDFCDNNSPAIPSNHDSMLEKKPQILYNLKKKPDWLGTLSQLPNA